MQFKFLIAAAAFAAFAGQNASAADLPSMPVKAPAQVVAYNWSGIYTASTIGGAGRESKGRFLDNGTAFNTDPWRGWTGSAVGIQHQWGNIVLGVEGSYSTPLSNKFDSSVGGGADCGAAVGTNCQTRLNSIWTVGGKAGYSFGNWMVYGTGGYARGRLQSRLQDTATGLFDSDFKTWNSGWYAGAGVDIYVTRFMWSDLIVGVEYRHIDLGSRNVNDPNPFNARSVDTTADMIMAKATFKWVGMGPLNMLK